MGFKVYDVQSKVLVAVHPLPEHKRSAIGRPAHQTAVIISCQNQLGLATPFGLPGAEGLHHGSMSPDGLRVAAISDDGKSVMMYDIQTHRQVELTRGAAMYSPLWAHDGREVFFQDIFQGSDQPIYRVRIADHGVERVTNFAQPFAADVTGYRLTGVTPDDHVLATLIRSNSDLYALDVDFP